MFQMENVSKNLKEQDIPFIDSEEADNRLGNITNSLQGVKPSLLTLFKIALTVIFTRYELSHGKQQQSVWHLFKQS